MFFKIVQHLAACSVAEWLIIVIKMIKHLIKTIGVL